jgi:flagellin-like hook-associated protein FlgL
MIPGLNSASVSGAIRTSVKARQTMDTMTRQIATGQRVSSVKDDGAAWARASALRSEAPQWAVRLDTLNRAEIALDTTMAWVTQTMSVLDRLGELVLAARTMPAGSSARQAIAAEWNQVTEWVSAANATGNNPGMTGTGVGSGWVTGGYDLTISGDDFYGPQTLSVWPNGSAFHNWFILVDAARPIALRGLDINNANSATLDLATTSINSLKTAGRNWFQNSGVDQRRVDRLQIQAEKAAALVEQKASTLTDADMGKASTARANAETRQQVAMQTVRSAITAYGNMASGLLGNVQRTQRGILA